MTQQVLYNAATGDIIQWQDTGAFSYPAGPAGTATLAVTAAQWAAQAPHQTVSGTPPVIITLSGPPAALLLAAFVASVQAALDATDTTMHRIAEGISLGSTSWTATDVVAWVTYRRALRALLASTAAGTLPSRPAYPAGT